LGISPQRGVDTLCLSKSKRMYHIPKADMGFIYLHISNTITRITYPISNIYLHAIYSIDTALIPESLHYTSVSKTNWILSGVTTEHWVTSKETCLFLQTMWRTQYVHVRLLLFFNGCEVEMTPKDERLNRP
jgi:hypothetical protein